MLNRLPVRLKGESSGSIVGQGATGETMRGCSCTGAIAVMVYRGALLTWPVSWSMVRSGGSLMRSSVSRCSDCFGLLLVRFKYFSNSVIDAGTDILDGLLFLYFALRLA